MHINLNDIMFQVKTKLGLLAISTPFKDLNGVIMKILQDVTIPNFSIVCPFKQDFSFVVTDFEEIKRESDSVTVLLPDDQLRPIIYVYDVRYDVSSLTGTGYYTTGMPVMMGDPMQQVILGNAAANLVNQMVPKMTFNFQEPRTLTLYNAVVTNKMRIFVGRQHYKNGSSIPETASQSFLKLALLDVKATMYPTLKMYSEINTSIANINLKLDEWANAESERTDLMNNWDDTYHLDAQPFYWI